MITVVRPKPMIAIELRPRRIPNRYPSTSSWPCVRMLKYVPTSRTARVTPPSRANVLRAQRRRERLTGVTGGAMSFETELMTADAAGAAAAEAAAAPRRSYLRSLLLGRDSIRQPRQRVLLELRQLRERRGQVRLGEG